MGELGLLEAVRDGRDLETAFVRVLHGEVPQAADSHDRHEVARLGLAGFEGEFSESVFTTVPTASWPGMRALRQSLAFAGIWKGAAMREAAAMRFGSEEKD